MGGFSLFHWLVLGIVILLLFGGNRFSSMMGDVAKGLKGFKQGLADEPVAVQGPAELPDSAGLPLASGAHESPSPQHFATPADSEKRS